MKQKNNIIETLLKVGVEIARKGEGAVFVVSDDFKKYKVLLPQQVKPFSIFAEGARKVLVSLAMIDGAVIISSKGELVHYGVLIESKKAFMGFGARHSAAYSASNHKGTTVVLVSEEEKKVKVFKEGKIIMQVDALEKTVDKNISEAANIFESIGAGTVSTIGISILVPTLGITLIPGVIIFGTSYHLLKILVDSLKTKR